MFNPDSKRHWRRWLLALAACVACASPASAQSAKELALFESLLSIADSYIELVVSTHDVNANDSTAVAMQLQKMKEVFEDSGDVDGGVRYFQSVLTKSDDRTVRNMTYMLLADILKEAGRLDEAQALLRDAIDESIAALAAGKD